MQLLQKPKETVETPSLGLWLSRDVPHERELADGLMERLGHEKSLETLLALHDKEETRRQKRTKRSAQLIVGFSFGMMAVVALLLYAVFALSSAQHLWWFRICVPLIWLLNGVIHFQNIAMWRGRKGKTPWFSTPVQQNIITALLDYADTPLVADALSRAIVYYTGDRDRLYEKLAQVLPMLPDDPEALTEHARAILWRRLSPAAVYPFPGEKERAPALRSAVARYFARTGAPVKKWWR